MSACRDAVISAAALLIGAMGLGWSGSARAAKVLYSLPENPDSALTADRAGNLYGLIGSPGGSGGCSATNCGTVFRLVPPAEAGQPWTEQTLYTFPPPGANGIVSYGSADGYLALDAAGNIYGTCDSGGRGGEGTAWRLSPPASPGGTWTLTLLHTFTREADGGDPESGLVMDHTGTLYGTTYDGGTDDYGVVFALTPPPPGGTAWTETTLHSFAARNDGVQSDGALVLSGHDTILTGVSPFSYNSRGKTQGGTVFRLRRKGNIWTYGLLYRFAGNPEIRQPAPAGALPNGPVVVDRNDNIFGTTLEGGSAGVGVVFEVSPPAPGQSDWTEQVLYNFTKATGGWQPTAGLIAGGSPPALFGVTSLSTGTAADGSTGTLGDVFRLDPPASGSGPWTYTALHTLDDGTIQIGGYPGPVTLSHHFLFGATAVGGKHNAGFIYQVRPQIPASTP